MTVVVYPAIVITRGAEPPQAAFVDFADVKVTAATIAALLAAARERLGAELLHLEQQGETWPEPTAMTAIQAPPGASIVLIDVAVDDTPIRLTISLGERLLKRIDQDAQARSMTRSGYLALGARRLLGDPAGPVGGGGETAQRLQEEVAALGRRVNDTLGPESPFGRTLAELDAMALNGLQRLGNELKSVVKGRSTKAAGEPSRPDETEPPTAE